VSQKTLTKIWKIINILLQIHCWIQRWKNFKNRPTFGKVINEKCRWTFWLTVYIFLSIEAYENNTIQQTAYTQTNSKKYLKSYEIIENHSKSYKHRRTKLYPVTSYLCQVNSYGWPLCLVCKVKHTWICIARLRANASNALRYGSHSVTCKQHHNCPYSQSQSITTLWPVLTVPTHGRMARLSWLGYWLDWDKFPAPGVEPRYGHPS